MTSPAALVNKVWNYAHVLRDDGVSYGDYVEQITCLLFLKMDQERHDHLGEVSRIPAEWRWAALKDKEGDELELQYRHTLEALAREPGLLGTIFRKAQNKIQDPAKLRRLVVMIDGETWIGLDVDVKGEIYEGLLERNAQEVKSGAGQYFTPRPLIRAMVEVIDPAPRPEDLRSGLRHRRLPARGVRAHEDKERDRERLRRLREETFTGVDIVDGVVRLCAMNLYLHGIGGEASPVHQGDALISAGTRRFELVLTNPPFGKKSSYTVVGEDGDIERESQVYERDDFIATTSNKQLNFLQHVMSILQTDGRPRWCCRTTCCSRAVLARRCAAGSCARSTSTRCCVCRPGSSIAQASRRTCCSSTRSRRARRRGPGAFGSMTSAPTRASR